MNTRQDSYLKEMGLGPRWRVRGTASATFAESVSAEPPQREPLPAETQPVVSVNASAPDRFSEVIPESAPERATEIVPEIISENAPDSRHAAVMTMDWPDLLAAIRQCSACPLHATRTQAVPGVGAERADWLFIGEAPGADEDAQGEPFVGQAGKLLDAMLAAIGLKRGDNVHIANVLKCRPPGNRNPAPQEVAQCQAYLLRQIELIQPKLIVALGKFAAQTLLSEDTAIARLRGRVHRYRDIPLIVTYHPAYLLRALPEKAKAWQDLCLAVKTLRERTAET
jgi:DNA polymerase